MLIPYESYYALAGEREDPFAYPLLLKVSEPREDPLYTLFPSHSPSLTSEKEELAVLCVGLRTGYGRGPRGKQLC